ncbi:MAG: hypothetical protein LBI10_04770 [Deltaproteobacteria bacterium]|jgi:hypothetical protein|nr:hypothetical protein [Deltaproteobacteria bacterium]
MKNVFYIAIFVFVAQASFLGCSPAETFPKKVGLGDTFWVNGPKGIDLTLARVEVAPDQKSMWAFKVIFNSTNLDNSPNLSGKLNDNHAIFLVDGGFKLSFLDGAIKSESLSFSGELAGPGKWTNQTVTVTTLVKKSQEPFKNGLISFNDKKGERVSIELDLSGVKIPPFSSKNMSFGEVVAVLESFDPATREIAVAFRPVKGDFASESSFGDAFNSFKTFKLALLRDLFFSFIRLYG